VVNCLTCGYKSGPEFYYIWYMKYLLLFLSALLVFLSCQKDPQVTQIAIARSEFLIIDSVSNVNVAFTNFQTPLYLYSSNSQKSYSLDVNADGSADYELIFNNMNGGCQGALFNRRARVKSLNLESYILTDSVFSMNSYINTTLTAVENRDSLFPKQLKIKDTLYTNDKFRNGNIFLSESNGWDCPPSRFSNDNVWYNKDKLYLGIKHKGRLGWIRINVSSSILIYGYALSK